MTERPQVAGWKERVALPDLGVQALRAKLDTGARTCALGIRALKVLNDERTRIRVRVPDREGARRVWRKVEVNVADWIQVRSSNGETEERPLIETSIVLGDLVLDVRLSLAIRDKMTYPMLVGRTALWGHFVVDSSKTFLLGDPHPDPVRPHGREHPAEDDESDEDFAEDLAPLADDPDVEL